MKKIVIKALADILCTAIVVVPLIILICQLVSMGSSANAAPHLILKCKNQIAVVSFFGLIFILGFYLLMHFVYTTQNEKTKIYKIIAIWQMAVALVILIVLYYCIDNQLTESLLKVSIIVGAVFTVYFIALDLFVLLRWHKKIHTNKEELTSHS